MINYSDVKVGMKVERLNNLNEWVTTTIVKPNFFKNGSPKGRFTVKDDEKIAVIHGIPTIRLRPIAN